MVEHSLPSGTVAFLFTDVEGSTKLWEAHGAVMGTAIARHDALMRQAIETHSGHVFKTVGDAFCCAFSTAPHAFEKRRNMALYEAFVYDLDGQESGSRTGEAPV